MSYVFYFFVTQLATSVLGEELQSRVFNGQQIKPGDHGYLVRLKIIGHKESGICTGSIINNEWIVSAAHCFKDALRVTVSHKTEGRKQNFTEVNAVDIIVHPDFVFDVKTVWNVKHDIALLKTTRPIKFDLNCQPIELASYLPKEELAIVAGYGLAEDMVTKPREGAVRVYLEDYNTLCSSDKVRSSYGDSGGPLVSRGRLIGIISSMTIKPN